jgi:hypothetical protein
MTFWSGRHEFRPELTNFICSGRINYKSLRMRHSHFREFEISSYAVRHSRYVSTHTKKKWARRFSPGPYVSGAVSKLNQEQPLVDPQLMQR